MSIRIFRHYVQLPMLLLMLLELGVAVAALWLAADHVREHNLHRLFPDWTLYVLFAGLMLVSSAAMGLYNARLRERLRGLAVRLVLAALATLLLMAIFTLILPGFEITLDRFALALGIAVAGDVALRAAFGRIVHEDYFKRRVLVYGAGRQAASIAGLKRRSDRIGFTIVGYVPSHEDTLVIPSAQRLDMTGDLATWCNEIDVDEIVVAMDDRRRAFPLHELLQCRLSGIQVSELLSFLERETGKVRLDLLNPSWMIFSDGFRRSLPREMTGRVLDIAASLALLAVAWPVMLLVAIAIKLDDGLSAPVLYRQTRVGLRGRPFEVLKFRSMTVCAEADGVARWARPGDQRVTRIGAVIRKLRLDELPQLFNVLKGDMRFVGPRPERPHFVAQLVQRIPYYAERHSVKPGITGWAQLCYSYGASEQDAAEKLQYDLYYIKNRSLVFDLAILIQTVEVVLFGKGAR